MGIPGNQAEAHVTREEFERFCQEGRLVGTPGNQTAAAFLKELLRQAGFVPVEDPPPTLLTPQLLIPLGLLMVWMALWRIRFVAVLPVLLALFGVMFRLWQGVRTGAPMAIYGVRSAKEANAKPCPTVFLCAHFDTASLPFPLHGSPFEVFLKVLVLLVALTWLARAIHPLVGLVGIGGILGLLVIPRNSSPGADDNASGVFAVIECLRRFGHAENVQVVPVFFNYEELGLLGSRAWVRWHLAKKGTGIPGVLVDPKQAYVINFDCVGRGRHIFVSGTRRLKAQLLRTPAAQALGARRTWLYPSDHLSFRPRWQAVSLARADRLWFLDLRWVHSEWDVPSAVQLGYLAEVAQIVEEFVQELSQYNRA